MPRCARRGKLSLLVSAADPTTFSCMTDETETKPPEPKPAPPAKATKPPKEIGGPQGPEPTRYGDWEVKGRCVDF